MQGVVLTSDFKKRLIKAKLILGTNQLQVMASDAHDAG